jgi:hypothetical protein
MHRIPFSSMTRLSNIKEVRNVAHSFCAEDPQALIAFDLDLTLLQPNCPAVSLAIIKKYQDILASLLEPLSIEQREELFNLMLGTGECRPMEPDTGETFSLFKQTFKYVIGLTASLTGRVGPYARFEVLRQHQCQTLGFDFSLVTSESEFCLDLPLFRLSPPLYYRGILFANGERQPSGKGDVLTTFLNATGWRPSRVVFVDDKVQNTRDVFQKMAKVFPNIPCLSIEYTRSSEEPPLAFVSAEEFKAHWSEGLRWIS